MYLHISECYRMQLFFFCLKYRQMFLNLRFNTLKLHIFVQNLFFLNEKLLSKGNVSVKAKKHGSER